MPKSELPKGWEWKKIGELVEISYGKGLPKSRRLNEGAVPVYGSNGRVGYHDSAVTNGPTIIIGRKGSIGEVHLSPRPCWPIDTTYFLDDFPEILLIDYFYYFLKSLDLSELNRAAAIPGIRRDDIYSVEIPVPPLEEQRRIVARIEELLTRIDQAKSLRQQSLTETSAIRHAALDQLFSGGGLDKYNASRLGNLSERITKGESPRWQGFGYVSDGPLFIRSENVLQGSIDVRNAARIPVGFYEKLRRSQLRKGDVLINLVGASIGRSAVFNEEIREANVNQAVAVITPNASLDSCFLMHYLLSPKVQQEIELAKVEAARPNISLTDLRELMVPVLPLDEQHRIVAHLDSLQEKINQLQRLQSETVKELEQLTQSILTTAFRGGL